MFLYIHWGLMKYVEARRLRADEKFLKLGTEGWGFKFLQIAIGAGA